MSHTAYLEEQPRRPELVAGAQFHSPGVRRSNRAASRVRGVRVSGVAGHGDAKVGVPRPSGRPVGVRGVRTPEEHESLVPAGGTRLERSGFRRGASPRTTASTQAFSVAQGASYRKVDDVPTVVLAGLGILVAVLLFIAWVYGSPAYV